MIVRIALGIEYNGTNFHGWQAQNGLPTIQETLEKALSKIANESITLTCAGRTDAGVHALGQVVHFDTTKERDMDAWTRGTNRYLPPSVVVRWAIPVDISFHARFSALSRRYRYLIFNHTIRSAIFFQRATWHIHPLNTTLMQQAANVLLGEQDFSSFRSSECMSKSVMRYMMDISIYRHQSLVVIEIEANAFLHHMVRNIVGVLLPIGDSSKSPEWMVEVLYAKDRRIAGKTASPQGLYLQQVRYPVSFDFPAADPIILL